MSSIKIATKNIILFKNNKRDFHKGYQDYYKIFIKRPYKIAIYLNNSE